MMKTCKTCKYWKNKKKDELTKKVVGECKLEGPVEGRYPVAGRDNGCSDHSDYEKWDWRR